MTPRQTALQSAVAKHYASSTREMGPWMWQHHVQWVADKAAQVAEKYGANVELVYAGALLHDNADATLDRDDENFDQQSENTARKMLQDCDFSNDEITFVLEEVIAPHSCYEHKPLPTTLEGKSMATADGLAHLTTDFYHQFEAMGLPVSDPKAFREWARNKLERDFARKLFFEDEKNQAKNNYLALKNYFAADLPQP